MWKLLLLLVLVGIASCDNSPSMYDVPVDDSVIGSVFQSPFGIGSSRYGISIQKFPESNTICYVLHNSYQGEIGISCVNTESEK